MKTHESVKDEDRISEDDKKKKDSRRDTTVTRRATDKRKEDFHKEITRTFMGWNENSKTGFLESPCKGPISDYNYLYCISLNYVFRSLENMGDYKVIDLSK